MTVLNTNIRAFNSETESLKLHSLYLVAHPQKVPQADQRKLAQAQLWTFVRGKGTPGERNDPTECSLGSEYRSARRPRGLLHSGAITQSVGLIAASVGGPSPCCQVSQVSVWGREDKLGLFLSQRPLSRLKGLATSM